MRILVYDDTIAFQGDKSMTSGYRPKVFLRGSSVGSCGIPEDVSVRESPLRLLPRATKSHPFFSLPFLSRKSSKN